MATVVQLEEHCVLQVVEILGDSVRVLLKLCECEMKIAFIIVRKEILQ